MSLNGHVALVTGASRGIGRAISLRLAEEGAAVGVNYRHSEAEALSLVREIEGAGGRSIALRADIGDQAQVAAMLAAIGSSLGPPDILINNAGMLARGDLEDFDLSQMEWMRRTNVDGLILVTRAVSAGMKRARWGRIVNLASIAAHGTTMPATTFYAATKAAVIVLTRRFAMELGPFGVTVNAIAPGFIRTDMVMVGRSQEEARALTESVAQRAMVRRVGEPADIAHAAAFLVSPYSGFITAQVLTVDGGRMDYMSHP